MIKFQVYQDRVGEYRWRLIAANGEIVAVGEGYTSRSSAVRYAEWVKKFAHLAMIV